MAPQIVVVLVAFGVAGLKSRLTTIRRKTSCPLIPAFSSSLENADVSSSTDQLAFSNFPRPVWPRHTSPGRSNAGAKTAHTNSPSQFEKGAH